MIIDAVLYNGEKDMLDLRICELRDRVDTFLVVEGTMTFTGKPRVVVHDFCMEHYNVLHKVVDDFPEASPRNAWKREAWQRNSILKGLTHYPEDTIVLVGDVDEIPSVEAIPYTIQPGELYILQQDTYHFNLNQKVKSSNNKFTMGMCTRVCRLDDLRKWFPQGVRNLPGIEIPNGGWHLSWMGSNETNRVKAESYSHQELKQYGGTYAVQVQARWDLQYEYVKGMTHLPRCIQDNPRKWQHYFAKGEYVES